MIRCYLPGFGKTRTETLSGREAEHAIRVLRVQPGAVATLFDGKGLEAQARVSHVNSRKLTLEIGKKREFPRPRPEITLAVAVPKKGKFEEIVDEATQLGVARILPLITHRNEVRFTPEQFLAKARRFAQIAVEACKQSGNPYLPDVLPMSPFEKVVASFPGYDLVLVAAVEGPHEPLLPLCSGVRPDRLLLLIGPEGDFTRQELEQARRAGAYGFSLGPYVLRCKTAALSSLSILSFLFREGTLRAF